MEINENAVKMLKKMKDNLDSYWEMVPQNSKFEDRFESRELRFSNYKSPELELYLVNENSFIGMCRMVFGVDKLSLSEAYDLVENLLINQK